MILALIMLAVGVLGGGLLGYRLGAGKWPWRGVGFSLIK